MPYVKKTKKFNRKAKKVAYRKRRTYNRRAFSHALASSRLLSSYSTTGVGLPKARLVNLHYTDWHSMATGDSMTYMINSAYDPYAAVGGHQPKGFDQWASFYNKYCVVGAKYRFTIYWDQGHPPATHPPVEFIQILNRDTVPTGGWTTYVETNSGSGYGVLGSDDTKSLVLTGKFSAKKFFNLANIKDNHSIGAAVTADPSYPAYVLLLTRGFGGITGLGEFTVKVDIEQSILFTEPAELGGS